MAVRLESTRGSAPALWGLALVASVAAHVGLFQLNPNLLSSAGGLPDAPAARIRPDVSVRPSEPERIREELPRLLERYAESNPTQQADPTLPDAPTDLAFLTEESAVVLPDVSVTAPASELQAADLPENNDSSWSPRQEVLAVTEPQVRETLDVMPRAFRDVEGDRPGAPDLTLPSDVPDLPFAGEAMGGDVGEPISFPGPSRETGALPTLGMAPGLEGGSQPPTLLPDLPDPIPEAGKPVKELIPTESLLRLVVRVYDPPEEPDMRYFKLQLMRNGIESLEVLPRDVVYLIDCSASMTERKLQLALDGVRTSLDTLAETDRVQVIAFRDRVEFFASEPRAATVFGKAQVRTFLSTLGARGQTDVFESLKALNGLSSDTHRPVLALLITDGVPTQGVQDTNEILATFSEANQGQVSIFGLGGGDRVNRRLLDFLSFQNRGFSLVSPVAEGLREVIPLLASELRRPVLTEMDVRFSGAVSPEVYPRSLSHLYVDRPWILIGKIPRETNRFAFQVVGEASEERHDILFPVELHGAPAGGASLRQEWAWQAGLEKLAEAMASDSEDAYDNAVRFFEEYGIPLPDAYRN